MRKIPFSSLARPLANIFLRLGSLATKMIFTLYMGRYFGLSELGVYGLVAACVAILVTLLGLRFDYVVSRDIVDATPSGVACKLRDQYIFYGINYLALVVIAIIVFAGPARGISREIVFYIVLLSVLENFASITTGNVISLHKAVLANVLFFIRAAVWPFPAMILGIFLPAYRTAEFVLFCWSVGIFVSLAATFFALRHLPWRQAMRVSIDWRWIKSGLGKTVFIWAGALGGVGSMYMDRFVTEHYLKMEYVGIISFYSAFAMAIPSLLYNSVFAFSFPRLISHYRKGDKASFRRETVHTTLQATLFTSFMALGVGFAVPILGRLFHRPEFAEYDHILWLILFGVWLRSATDSLYYVLYARHQDRLIWISGALSLIPAFGCNMILVPRLGFIGIGYGAVITAVLLSIWRVYCILGFTPGPLPDAQEAKA